MYRRRNDGSRNQQTLGLMHMDAKESFNEIGRRAAAAAAEFYIAEMTRGE